MVGIAGLPWLGAGCADAESDAVATVAAESRGHGGWQAPTLTPQVSGTVNRLQAIGVVNERVVWVSGLGGSILRTTDGGATWETRGIPGTETLQFRDIHAVSKDVAFVMTNNGGANARIYKTEDGGLTWTLQFQSPIAIAFYDCFAFWSPRRGIAIPDAENGHFDVIRMTDGHTWENIGDRFPAGQAGEGLFPASGTCVTTLGARRAWAAMGGGAEPRVISTRDGGDTWTSTPIPMGGTATSGGISILFRDRRHGILGGGELAAPAVQQDNFARSSDGGETWELAPPAPFPGPLFGLAYADPRGRHGFSGDDRDDRDDDDGDDGDRHPHEAVNIVATGPGGSAWSTDEGDTWHGFPADVTGYFAVAFATPRTGWLVGTTGRILRIDF
jgi:photosystem II stability/assembly factor-like uncharacterized protein